MASAPVLEKDFPPAIQLEVLEWGKLCSYHDGPIVRSGAILSGIEHGLLGHSPGFPESLRSVCDPSQLGVSQSQIEEESERLFAKKHYATVLRPVHLDGRVFRTFYRVGVRSEEGALRPQGRSYSLARYLVDPAGNISPLALYGAVGPLVGLTQEEARQIDAVLVRETPLKVDVEDGRFLRSALAYLASGIPVHISSIEREFFQLVDTIWCHLPPDVQPLLSAGWNVASSLSRVLLISSTKSPHEACACYARGEWTPPRVSPSDPRLGIGEVFANEVLLGVKAGADELLDRLIHAGESSLIGGAPQDLPQFPSFADAATVRRFLDLGASILEAEALAQIGSWVRLGQPSLEDRLEDLMACLKHHPGLTAFVRSVLADVPHGERTDLLLWAYCGCQPQAELDGKTAVGETARIRLFAAVRGRGSVSALRALLAAAQAGDASELPDYLVNELALIFPATIGESSTHALLLQQPGVPDSYQKWAHGAIVELALLFAAGGEIPGAGLSALRRFPGLDPRVVEYLEALERFSQGSLPVGPDRGAIRAMDDSILAGFAALVEKRLLNCEDSSARENLLAWCEGFPKKHFHRAELVLATGEDLSSAEIQELLKRVDDVPSSLQEHLAQQALDHIGSLPSDLLSQDSPLIQLARFWPSDAALVFLGVRAGDAESTPSPSTIPWRPHVIHERLSYWLEEYERDDCGLVPQAVSVLWKWACMLPGPMPTSGTAVDVLPMLQAGRFPPELAEYSLTEQEDALVQDLVRRVGRRISLKAALPGLWASANAGWQLKLLLEMFPEEPVVPSTLQLGLLIPYRESLRSHLSRPRLHPERNRLFAIAACGFQRVEYPGHNELQWREEYRGSLVSASFCGLSREKQGDLAKALQAFGCNTPERTHLALVYLLKNPDSVQIVLRAFLLPLVQECGIGSRQWQRLLDSLAEGPCKKSPMFIIDASLSALPFKPVETRIRVASYMMGLLSHLVGLDRFAEVKEFSAQYLSRR